MSGGVDSAAAALFLKDEGHDVGGVTLRLTDRPASGPCCAPDGTTRAAAIADALGIPHYTLDAREVFRQTVIADFVNEYARGRTPNPCVRCNRFVKFTWLMERMVAWGYEALATGHYVRRETDASGNNPVLRRATNRSKDQSYFLWDTPRSALPRLLFPLGPYAKDEVKKLLRRRLPSVSPLPENQDACFITAAGPGEYVRTRRGEGGEDGPINNEAGEILGVHRGVAHYTVGQRRGLGVASSKRLYVKKIDAVTNTIVLGEEAALQTLTATVVNVNWLVCPPALPIRADVKVRYRDAGGPAYLDEGGDGRIVLSFPTPRRAVAPGQSAVFYDDDLLLGGGVIDEVYD